MKSEHRAPDRLLLTIDEHEVELVMSESQWGNLVTIPHGILQRWRAADDNAACPRPRRGQSRSPYVVYDMYATCTVEPTRPAFSERGGASRTEHRRFEALREARPDAEVEMRAFSPGEARGGR